MDQQAKSIVKSVMSHLRGNPSLKAAAEEEAAKKANNPPKEETNGSAQPTAQYRRFQRVSFYPTQITPKQIEWLLQDLRRYGVGCIVRQGKHPLRSSNVSPLRVGIVKKTYTDSRGERWRKGKRPSDESRAKGWSRRQAMKEKALEEDYDANREEADED